MKMGHFIEVRFPKHDGIPAGEVVEYTLSEKELTEVIAKYGPPGKYKNQKKPYLILDNYYDLLGRG